MKRCFLAPRGLYACGRVGCVRMHSSRFPRHGGRAARFIAFMAVWQAPSPSGSRTCQNAAPRAESADFQRWRACRFTYACDRAYHAVCHSPQRSTRVNTARIPGETSYGQTAALPRARGRTRQSLSSASESGGRPLVAAAAYFKSISVEITLRAPVPYSESRR